MNPEYILWGVPAYLAFLVFQLAKPVRNRSGWDFVVSLAIFALIIYTVVNVAFMAIHGLICERSWSRCAEIWKSVFPSPGSSRIALGIFLSGPVGAAIGVLWFKILHRLLSWFGHALTGRRKSYQFSDVFFATCHDLLGKPVLLTLNNSKVYVGVLLQATDDPNETARFIKIMPVMSGHREKLSGQVTFDTDYVGKTQQVDQLPNRDLLISMSNVVTLARFDVQLHEWFVETGRTVVRSSEDVLDPENAVHTSEAHALS